MKNFNIVISGVGGQGIVTLTYIIGEAALKEGLDVKTSELHGLAQRYGHIECHAKFGDKIYSPLVMEGKADLVIGLEPLETLRACYYGSKENKTIFLLDSFKIVPLSVPLQNKKYPSLDSIAKSLKQFSRKVIVLKASEIVEKATGGTTMSNIYMLGYICGSKLIPLKKKSLLFGIEETVPEEYIEINEKVFEAGCRKKKAFKV